MMEAIRSWFEALSSREKTLITILLALLAGFIAFYGIFKPFAAAMEDAEMRYQQAIERQVRIESKTEIFGANEQGHEAEEAPLDPNAVTEIVSQSAGEVGFATSAINTQGDGSVTMSIDSAKPTALFRWIALLEKRGVMLTEISAFAGANETISATLKLQ